MKSEGYLGLDGFSILFFKRYWGAVKGDLLKLMIDFFAGKLKLHFINYS